MVRSKKDYLVTFFYDSSITRIPLSEILENKNNSLFFEDLGLPIDFNLSIELLQTNESSDYFLTVKPHDSYQPFLNKEIISKNEQIKDGDYITFKKANNRINVFFQDLENLKIGHNKYFFPNESEYFIGRNDENDIIYRNNYISRSQHVGLYKDKSGRAIVKELKPLGKLYVNGHRCSEKKLNLYDEIYIMGLTIVYLDKKIAISKNATVNNLILENNELLDSPYPISNNKTFVRTPRIVKSLKDDEVEISPPPTPKHFDKTPAILTLGPSITMGIIMLASTALSIFSAANGGNLLSILGSAFVAVGMLIGTFLWPTLLRSYQKRSIKAEEKFRVEKYNQYINKIDKELEKKRERSIALLNNELYPDPGTLLKYLDNDRMMFHLWERSTEDSDFLLVRLGLGQRDFNVKLKIPKEEFQLEEDSLKDLPSNLKKKYNSITNVPITINLKDNKTIGLVGHQEKIDLVLDEIILNLIALHSYDEVKLVFISSPGEAYKFKAFKNLPHTWSNDKRIRYFATNKEEVHYIFNEINEELEIQKEKENSEENSPYYIFIISSPDLLEKESFSRYLYKSDETLKFTSIFAYGDINKLPKSTETIIQSDNYRIGFYTKNENENKFIRFNLDSFDRERLEKFALNLSKLSIKHELGEMSIPEKISFLEMFKVGNVEDLNIRENWENNHADKSLAVPIGVMGGNETFDLDLHEDYHGSHGLVAGTTGSGKSEFLQSFVLSLSTFYSPNEVAFVLIDFKGGDMARPFIEKTFSPALPHLAATISNLTTNILYRALISIDAEINRRQEIINQSALKLGLSKLDINGYQKYFKEGKLTVPLPHLVIIIDEFAQLRTEQPDFLDELKRVAQVGRSSGIHLILATQRPTGIVDPQIWSNSKFKICLRVADKQDSIEIINKPDAALIKNPGRFYVQIGYDEIFDYVQSGYSGAPYYPTKRYISDNDVTVKMIDNVARTIGSEKIDQSIKDYEQSQIEAVTKEIIKVSQEKNLKAKPLWLPVLKEKIVLSEIKKEEKGLCSATVGILDFIKEQEQSPLTINFDKTGNIILYGAGGMGKTTFIDTLIYSMIVDYKYTPEELNIYAFDFSGRNLGYLNELPHCGGTAFIDESEKLNEIIKILKRTIEERKIIFQEYSTSNFRDFRKSNLESLPAILVVIDNYAPFHDRYPELVDELLEIISSGNTYGIYFLITGVTKNSIYYKIIDNVSSFYTLRLNDPNNYIDIHNLRSPIIPENIPGRGITKVEKQIVEFQFALPLENKDGSSYLNNIKALYKKIREEWKGRLPTSINRKENIKENHNSDYDDKIESNILEPIESNENSLILAESESGLLKYGLNLTEDFKLSLYMNKKEEFIKFYERIINNLDKHNKKCLFIDIASSFEYFKDKESIVYVNNSKRLDKIIELLRPSLNDRLEKIDKNHEQIFIIIPEYSKFFETITDEQATFFRKLVHYINKPEYGIYFISGFDFTKERNNDSLFMTLFVHCKNSLIAPNAYNEVTKKVEYLPIIKEFKEDQYYFIKDDKNFGFFQ